MARAAPRGGGRSGSGGPGLRAWLQLAARLQVGDHRLSQVPEFAPSLSRDLISGSELAQAFVTDLQLIGSDCERDQSILLHARDFNAYPNSLPHRCLCFPQLTDRMLGKSKVTEVPPFRRS